MDRFNIFKEMYRYLVFSGKVKNVVELATSIKANRVTVSNALNGNKKYLTDSLMNRVNTSFGNIFNKEWMRTGEGQMLVNQDTNTFSVAPLPTRPRVPYTVAAGKLTEALEGITEEQCERIPVINALPEYDFTIIVKGDSMEPKFEGGDEIACKRIDDTSFIQWGKVHVLDTAQGLILKRIYEDGDKIKCVSYNKDYPDFSIDKREIYSMNLVVGLVRI